jgi:hypothetical protein
MPMEYIALRHQVAVYQQSIARPKLQPSDPTWKAFLTNHIKDIVACDFFTVPTATCRVLRRGTPNALFTPPLPPPTVAGDRGTRAVPAAAPAGRRSLSERLAARRGTAVRRLDRRRRRGSAEASRMLWGEALGMAGSEKLAGGGFRGDERVAFPPNPLPASNMACLPVPPCAYERTPQAL